MAARKDLGITNFKIELSLFSLQNSGNGDQSLEAGAEEPLLQFKLELCSILEA